DVGRRDLCGPAEAHRRLKRDKLEHHAERAHDGVVGSVQFGPRTEQEWNRLWDRLRRDAPDVDQPKVPTPADDLDSPEMTRAWEDMDSGRDMDMSDRPTNDDYLRAVHALIEQGDTR